MKYFNIVLVALMSNGLAFAATPNFSLLNNSSKNTPIWVALINGQDQEGSVQKVEPGKQVELPLASNASQTFLAIWLYEPKDFKLVKQKEIIEDLKRTGRFKDVIVDKETIGSVIKPSADYIYTFPKSKTIYVTFEKGIKDNKKRLYPQSSGWLSGSKYSLNNNVLPAEINLLIYNPDQDLKKDSDYREYRG